MRKLSLLLFSLLFISSLYAECTNYSSYYQEQIWLKRDSIDLYKSFKYSDNTATIAKLEAELTELEWKARNANVEFQACVTFDKWIAAYKNNDLDWAIKYFKDYVFISPNRGSDYVTALRNIWLCYSQIGKINDAKKYYSEALNAATDPTDIEKVKTDIAMLESPSNDKYAYAQYYLQSLNIPAAWSKVKNSNQVVVAIIDDGIYLNHPDLVGKIWQSPNAKYGESKIIDFVGDKASNLAVWDHGTMIAGIIWATINNNEGIAGISKNVLFMPLRVFGVNKNASDDDVIKAINYAIDNGANIINLSLWGSQFAPYSEKYDSVIKRAYDKGVIVVIAAGNGDIYSKSQSGLDLSINPISPVCNNKGNTDYSIGVGAYTKEGYRTWWTNYNWCIGFFAPWEWIVSTSIPLFNEEFGKNYNIKDGTSFSAPMITGIIALGYNQYGFVSPKTVKESLNESLVKNSAGNTIVDASKYLDALSKRINIIKSEQANRNTKTKTNGQKTIDVNSDWNFLANLGIIKQQQFEEDYKLSSNVLRQEVIWMAMKLGKFDIPENYSCKKVFSDVSASRPNNWICRAVEIAVDKGVVSSQNKLFKPESNITRAEALAILMKAAGITIDESNNVSHYSDVTVTWQVNLINTAFSNNIIDDASRFFPNNKATRWEIFNMARRILESKTK